MIAVFVTIFVAMTLISGLDVGFQFVQLNAVHPVAKSLQYAAEDLDLDRDQAPTQIELDALSDVFAATTSSGFPAAAEDYVIEVYRWVNRGNGKETTWTAELSGNLVSPEKYPAATEASGAGDASGVGVVVYYVRDAIIYQSCYATDPCQVDAGS